MSNRPLTSALRSLRWAHGSSTRSANTALRGFSTTSACGVRAVFNETENAELNSILRSIQEKIVLPAHLPEKQRKMVFDPNMRSHLQQNPIIIEVEGLEHKFSPLDRFNDVENSKKILNKALQSMESAEDWNNLPTLLAGYKKAGIKLKPDNWGKIVRLAGTKGHIYSVIESAKQADETGFYLTNRETVMRILAYVNDKITTSAWDEAETKQALRWTELVLDLLQRPEHAQPGVATQDRMHFSRVVRGMVLLARASAIKVKQQAGENVDKDLTLLKDDVELLRSLWTDVVAQDLSQVEEFVKLNPVVERNERQNARRAPQALNGSAYVQVLAQNIKGASIAKELLSSDSNSSTLTQIEDALNAHLQSFVQSSPSRPESWAQEYEKAVGQSPQWPASS